MSLLYHRIFILSRPFLTFFVDSGSLTSGCLLTPPPAWGVSFCFPCGHRAEATHMNRHWGRALRINPLEPPSQVGDFVTPLDCLYCITGWAICQALFLFFILPHLHPLRGQTSPRNGRNPDSASGTPQRCRDRRGKYHTSFFYLPFSFLLVFYHKGLVLSSLFYF